MVVFNAARATSRRTCPMYNTKGGWRGGRAWRASVQRDSLAFLCVASAPQEGRRGMGTRRVSVSRRLSVVLTFQE